MGTHWPLGHGLGPHCGLYWAATRLTITAETSMATCTASIGSLGRGRGRAAAGSYAVTVAMHTDLGLHYTKTWAEHQAASA